jgi:hypothetical protein
MIKDDVQVDHLEMNPAFCENVVKIPESIGHHRLVAGRKLQNKKIQVTLNLNGRNSERINTTLQDTMKLPPSLLCTHNS